MSDLAARLVHDAAEAIDGRVRGDANPDDFISTLDDWTGEARAAVVAVLEALAAECAGSADWRFVDAAGFRRLAERVREARNG